MTYKWKKGQSGNPAGRKKGSKNKRTLHWQEMGEYIVTEGVERYVEILKKLPDKEFQDRFESIVEYFKPKLARTEHRGSINLKKHIGEDRAAQILNGMLDALNAERSKGVQQRARVPRKGETAAV